MTAAYAYSPWPFGWSLVGNEMLKTWQLGWSLLTIKQLKHEQETWLA